MDTWSPFLKASLTVYVVRNDKGKFFRSAQRNRTRGWVDDIIDAVVYTKTNPAKGQVTRLKNEGLNVELVTLVAKEE